MTDSQLLNDLLEAGENYVQELANLWLNRQPSKSAREHARRRLLDAVEICVKAERRQP